MILEEFSCQLPVHFNHTLALRAGETPFTKSGSEKPLLILTWSRFPLICGYRTLLLFFFGLLLCSCPCWPGLTSYFLTQGTAPCRPTWPAHTGSKFY